MRNLIRALIAALALAALPLVSQAELFVGVSVNVAPPLLPVYVQPPCPAPGYIWIPGYWAWDDGYYWVPGTWVLAPAVGLLWTPGYWGWADGVYVWNAGYWGPHVGFYGGIDYGFGYTGVGYQGGYWRGNQFYYNRSVTNINTTNITNVYNRTVVNNVNVTRVSFNGGAGGVVARPGPAELAAERERHQGLTPVQRQQEQSARSNSSLRAAANGGHPPIAATPKAGVFSGRGVVAARGAEPAASAPRPIAQRSERPPVSQRASPPVREAATARAPAPPRYASAQSSSREPGFERPSRAEPTRSAPRYPVRPTPQYEAHKQSAPAPHQAAPPAPHYQAAPAPHYQAAAAPHYQAAPAPHYQAAPPAPHYQAAPPAPHYQAAPAPHYQAAPAPRGSGQVGHEQRPEQRSTPERPGEHNGHG